MSSHPQYRLTSQKLKACVFAMEALNSLATTWFFYYIYYYTQEQFKFGALQNFLLAAALGVASAVSSFFGGRFAQRFGYIKSVKIGAAGMAVLFLTGSQCEGLAAILAVTVAANCGQGMTWPAMQGMMSEGEPPARLRSLVGIYNVTWSAASAAAYFTGGAIFQRFGLKSLFYLPAAMLLVEVALAFWLEAEAQRRQPAVPQPLPPPAEPEAHSSPIPPRVFLQMALLANPFAYLGINTVIATLPTLSQQFNLTVKTAGFVCSAWLFARAAAFVWLKLWPDWHYRFRYLAGAYAAMIASFGTMLATSHLSAFLLAQVVFGLAIGLIYYSSLYYSLDVGETKSEHGGIHEAAIGAGNAGGPALAAAAMFLFPAAPNAGAAAVSGLLVLGLAGLYWFRYRPAT